MLLRFVFIFTLSLVYIYAEAFNLIGPWNGTISLGNSELPLVVRVTESERGLSATLDSPLQGAKDIPADMTVTGDTIEVRVPAIGVYYKGVVGDGKIEGTFKQNGMSLPLSLDPGEYIPPRPQTPNPPFAYEACEIEIVNPTDSAVLSATLTLPIQYIKPTFKDMPLVVMVSGSGLQNRDEEIMGHKPFAVLADYFACNGIASIRYDDRGFGESTGDVKDATTATFATDAAAVVDYARQSVPRVGKVGVLGHSEGGQIVFMLGAEGKMDFGISLAGSALRGDSILLLQNERILSTALDRQTVDDYVKALRRVLAYMEANPQAREWPEMADAMSDLTHLTAAQTANLLSILATRNTWMDHFLTFDPASCIAATNEPIMAINGTLDMQVIAEPNLKAISDNLPDNPKTMIRAYPGLNHLFQNAKTGSPEEYGIIEETISEEVLRDIVAWIKTVKK